MPFSALSPDGPVSLLGADAVTVENMRARNRAEACYTAKCCGALLTIRTAGGKAPHFVHKVVPPGCDVEKGETPEHRRLKEVIAKEAGSTFEWDVETEAVHKDDATQKVIWKADVLALRPRAKVAFEVQFSSADYEAMRQRQARYKASSVRGLWFVRTKKGFPVTKELPIFRVETDRSGDWVSLATTWDRVEIWQHADGQEFIELPEFIRATLAGNLKWAPYEGAGDTWLKGSVVCAHDGECPGCKRTVVRHRAVTAQVASDDSYPLFMFGGADEYRRKSEWYMPLVTTVWHRERSRVELTFRSAKGTCCWCSTPLKKTSYSLFGYRFSTLTAALQMKDLPKPRFGSAEQTWLRRWTVVDR